MSAAAIVNAALRWITVIGVSSGLPYSLPRACPTTLIPSNGAGKGLVLAFQLVLVIFRLVR